MHKFGFILAILVSFATAAYADNTTVTTHNQSGGVTAGKVVNGSPVADSTHQVHPDARTKQTVTADKKTALFMPVADSQRVRADQLELNLIQESVRQRQSDLLKRINATLSEYDTTIQEIEFDTGAIHRVPKASPASKK